ncbi:hypothetical protein GQ457_HM001390 [Hibiscus cannabinus]
MKAISAHLGIGESCEVLAQQENTEGRIEVMALVLPTTKVQSVSNFLHLQHIYVADAQRRSIEMFAKAHGYLVLSHMLQGLEVVRVFGVLEMTTLKLITMDVVESVLELKWGRLVKIVKEHLGKEVETGGYEQHDMKFSVEPFIENNEEFYLNIVSVWLGTNTSFLECGRIESEENWGDKSPWMFDAPWNMEKHVLQIEDGCGDVAEALPATKRMRGCQQQSKYEQAISERRGIRFLMFDGKLVQKQREIVLKESNDTREKMVLLMSLKAGGVGLDLTAASKAFFTNSGSEANNTHVMLVWYYHNALRRPNKKKFIARAKSYRGSTLISVSLSGLPALCLKFDLQAPFVSHTDCPHYRCAHLEGETEEEFSTRLTNNLENLILKEGPETIVAFIAKPVMGAGGVIPPPATYFEKIQATKNKNASLIDGLHVICSINESMIVAIVYGLDKKATKVGEKNVVIFDLGDNNFDVPFLLIEESVFEVKLLNFILIMWGRDANHVELM